MWRFLTLFSLIFLATNAQDFHCFSSEFGKLYAVNYRYPQVSNPVLFQAGFDPYTESTFRAAAVVSPPNFDPGLNFNLGTVTNWYTPAPADNFLVQFANYQSLRYSGIITPETSGPVNFTMRCDDGCRMFIDGVLVLDMWKSSDVNSGQVFNILNLEMNRNYTVNVEYFQAAGTAGLILYPINLFQTRTRACIPNPTPKKTTCNLAPRGLSAEFYSNNDFTGSTFTDIITRADILSFNFTGVPYGLDGFVSADYSVKFTGLFVSPFSGEAYFWARGSEYCKIILGGVNVLEFGLTETLSPAFRKGSILVNLIAGRAYDIEIWYSDRNLIPNTITSQMFFGITTGRSNANDRIIVPSMLRACLPYAIIAPEIVIVTNFEPTPIPIVLSLPPSGPVNVSFTLESGVTVSPCMLYFTPENWNVTQYIYAKTTITNRKIFYIPEGFEYTGIDSTPTTLTFSVPPSSSSKTCTSWGDPHFITFSGTKFDFFGVGDFYLYRSLDSSFIVQARHFACGSASCNGAFAIRYFDAVTILSFAGSVPTIYENAFVPLATGYSKTVLSNGYEFNYPNGIQVVITLNYWGQGKTFYLDIDLIVPDSFQGRSRGLCGTHDSSKGNDFVLPDGVITDNLGKFTESWRVPFEENIFEENLVPIGTLPGAPNTGSPTTQLTDCTSPPPVDPPRPPIDPPVIPPTPPCDITIEQAETHCLELFNMSQVAKECAAKGVDTNTLYNNCVDEVFLLCDFLASIPPFNQLNNDCPPPPECPGNCLGNGECSVNGCVCLPGFLEPNCRPTFCPATETISPSHGGPGTTVELKGVNFQDGIVYTCHFEGNDEIVIAKVIDPFTATCVVPNDAINVVTAVELTKDGKACSDNPPKFNYTFGITECVNEGDGFGTIDVGSNKTINDCPLDEYGGRFKSCSDRAKPSSILDNCMDCPLLSQSPPGSDSIEDCQCPPGYILEEGECREYTVITPPDVCANASTPVPISIVLSRQPSENVQVTLMVDNGVTVSQCIFNFTTDDWNQPQYFYAFTTSNGLQIRYLSTGGQYTNAINKPTDICRIEIPVMPKRTCISWGDPHFVTFSNKNYDFQGIGEYYLFKTDDESFVIQSLQFGCAPGFSCNWAIAIRYYQAVIILSLDQNPWKLYESPYLAQVPQYTKTIINNQITFTFPNHVDVTITRNFWNTYRVPYLNFYVNSPSYLEGLGEGLCGTQDGNKNNDFVRRDGVFTTDLMNFANSWEVPPNESIFSNDLAVIPTDANFPLNTYSQCPSVLPPLTPRSPPTPPPPIVNPISCSLSAKEIQDFCANFFLNSDAAKNCLDPSVDLNSYYQNCLTEVSVSCDFSAAGPAANVFNQKCPTPTPPCPDNCNFQGQCLSDGTCNCLPGFELPTCTAPTCARTISISPTSGSPGDILILSGSGFAGGTTYECVFNGKNVDASVISPTAAQCQVPLDFKGAVVTVYLTKDGESCDNTGPSFTYDEGISDCPADSGFPMTASDSLATVFDCPPNTYGSRERYCSLFGEWSTIVDNCISCPIGASSPPNSKIFDNCACPSGFFLEGNECLDINECETNNGNCHPIFGICTNTIGSRDCECYPGYDGDGVICDPDANTQLADTFGPIARFLFEGNYLDSSGHNRTITQPHNNFEPFYLRDVPTNQALRVNGNILVTSILPLDRTITIAMIVNLQAMGTSTILQLQPTPNPFTPFSDALLSIEIGSTGKLHYRRFGISVGVTQRFLLTGRSYYLIFSIRENKIYTFIDTVRVGTFNLNTPANYNLHLLTGRNLNGYIDELTVYDEPVYNLPPNSFTEVHANAICINPCVSPSMCYNGRMTFQCGQLLATMP